MREVHLSLALSVFLTTRVCAAQDAKLEPQGSKITGLGVCVCVSCERVYLWSWFKLL